MITELLFNISFATLNFFINFFPALVIPTDLLNALGGLVECLAIVSYFMPIGILQLSLITWLAFQGLRFIVSVVNWLISKIPTIE
ncbi:MAG: hypothetical protein ABF649_22925 [Bacillus sp. (in: firmicutes)]